MDMKNKKIEAIVFYLAVTLFFLLNLGQNPLWGSEDRWAEVARSMCFSGDWLHPAVNGMIYFDKPLLSYWPIAIIATLCGSINEFIVRLPSVIAALIALWGTRFLAEDMFKERKITILSGWILMGFYGFFFWARAAAAEMLNLAAVIVALAWFFHYREKRSFGVYLIFWLICFTGMLAKGMPALILPVAVAAVWTIASGNFKRHFCWQNVAAFPIGLVVALLPFYLSYKFPMPEYYTLPAHHLSGVELLIRENLTRAFEAFDHNDEPFWIYFAHVPRIMMPLTLAGIAALVAAISDWKKNPLEVKLLWLGCATIFILFSISESRRWYYILPILPLLAIATAFYMTKGGKFDKAICKAYIYIAWVIGGSFTLIGIAALAVGPFTKYAPLLQRFGVIPSILTIAGAVAMFVVALRCRNWDGVVAVSVITVVTVFGVVYPATGNFRTEKAFAFALREKLPDVNGSEMLFFAKDAPKITFYMGLTRRVDFAREQRQLPALLKKFAGREVYIITTNKPKTLQDLRDTLPQNTPMELVLAEDYVDILESPKEKKWHCYRIVMPADYGSEQQ